VQGPVQPFPVPPEAAEVAGCRPLGHRGHLHRQLVELAVRDEVNGWHEVAYDVPGKGRVVEARVCRTKNGINANYLEPYMRRRDPDCMVIGDNCPPTSRPTRSVSAGISPAARGNLRLAQDPGSGRLSRFMPGWWARGTDALVIAPANAGFFASGWRCCRDPRPDEIPEGFAPRAVIYVAPPFRHTHFEGKQVVVHNRLESAHELFSYNLYPGPSAKKGIYGVLLNIGEAEQWVTMHCSTVQVITPTTTRSSSPTKEPAAAAKARCSNMPTGRPTVRS
jgi:hypothetical protein